MLLKSTKFTGQGLLVRLSSAPGDGWMVRAHAERKTALIVVGPFGKEWTPAAVVALLQPLVGDLELICFEKP